MFIYVTRIVTALILGWALAHMFGHPRRSAICAILALAGSTPFLGLLTWSIYLYRSNGNAMDSSREAIALLIMLNIAGNLGMTMLPAIPIESERSKQRIVAQGTPSMQI